MTWQAYCIYNIMYSSQGIYIYKLLSSFSRNIIIIIIIINNICIILLLLTYSTKMLL